MSHIHTQAINVGRTPQRFDGLVNTPVFRGSTILANSFKEWEQTKQNGDLYRNYGRFGTATTKSFEKAINDLEGGAGCMVFPSGLSACTHALMAFVKTGDHVLIADNIYGPTRNFADHVLTRLGITVEYFDSTCLAELQQKINAKTSVVFIESPGSITFEFSDVAAISDISHQYAAKVLVDNSWATPLFFKPLEHGADVSIQAVTKYIGGHSDLLMGTATANAESLDQLNQSVHFFGETTSPDDLFLALRGLRSLAVRLKQHHDNGIALAQCLVAHPAVDVVCHPALPNSPDHALWQRDFAGASGLFSFYLKTQDPAFVESFFDRLEFFHIGLSWGGYESLVLPVGKPYRSASTLPSDGYLIRIHAGLEHVEDLKADLYQALDQAANAI
ncbi:MAG: cystathionine beta-lyase [Acinetobacter populi]|jgi:cystathionine beta-lyase|uniref:cystathionine beta-lyase n=1 Tax=Acinetobacter populi TaxID=1582270 RepID=UPI0023559CB5|nr:cystathionine beta-lyase [Acinetobacter populi]MCH4248052.1 cystathionine beta-lyase [Acinetobacter populi]